MIVKSSQTFVYPSFQSHFRLRKRELPQWMYGGLAYRGKLFFNIVSKYVAELKSGEGGHLYFEKGKLTN